MHNGRSKPDIENHRSARTGPPGRMDHVGWVYPTYATHLCYPPMLPNCAAPPHHYYAPPRLPHHGCARTAARLRGSAAEAFEILRKVAVSATLRSDSPHRCGESSGKVPGKQIVEENHIMNGLIGKFHAENRNISDNAQYMMQLYCVG